MFNIYEGLNETSGVLLTLCVILTSGFLLTRLTKLIKLPNVSGFILAGILVGPYALNLVSAQVVSRMGFISDIALAFIAFDVGRFFKRETVRATGGKTIVITLFESLAAGIAVAVSMRFIFNLSWAFSVLLGSIATATAPASTIMTINQYNAKGRFVNTLLQVVALDDVECLIVFSTVSALIKADGSENFAAFDVLLPILYNIAAVGMGFFTGYLLNRVITPGRSRENRLILVIALLLGICGVCALCDVSPLLACMACGAAYINSSRDETLFCEINHFTPPITSAFFIISGINFDIGALTAVGMMGVCYFLIRLAGKYAGAYAGCLAAHEDRRTRSCLGIALAPQAGVAIGLAFLGQRMLPPEIGDMLLSIVLSSSMLYELAGPVCAKTALTLSGSIVRDSDKGTEKPHTPVFKQPLINSKK